jgi:ADP-ribosylglycohydrolase
MLGAIIGDIVGSTRERNNIKTEDSDRFEAFVNRPLYQSYYVDGHVFAGEYPGDKYETKAKLKIPQMVHFGVRHFVDLTEEGELNPYAQLLPENCTYTRFPIRDVSVPKSMCEVEKLIGKINELSRRDDGYVYIHCWGGVGRTGTIVGCYLAEQSEDQTFEDVLRILRDKFAIMPKSSHRVTPETKEQEAFIKNYVEYMENRKLAKEARVKDCVRGSLMAGAAGDALGYPVEFMSRSAILSRYGDKGITRFEIDSNSGKALVSDDTQMTLFTANGMLMGITRVYMRGIGTALEDYVEGAYLDWYYTQTGLKPEWSAVTDFHFTWLRDLPELAHRRAPGTTCMSACESLRQHEEPHNNSKGCGGIMRVAPMGLYNAVRKGIPPSSLAETGAKIAKVTHLHPLGYFPAALLTLLLDRITLLTPEEVKESIYDIIEDGLDIIMNLEGDEHYSDKVYLRELTNKAVELSQSGISDSDAIRQLGEGWTGDEAWAISLYCALRHIDSMRDAIIAAVNHSGDSDSTGSITGNIMGAIYGYEAIKRERLFCPEGREFEDTIELANIILALADDLYSCWSILNFEGYVPPETPEMQQWCARYIEMKPVGI